MFKNYPLDIPPTASGQAAYWYSLSQMSYDIAARRGVSVATIAARYRDKCASEAKNAIACEVDAMCEDSRARRYSGIKRAFAHADAAKKAYIAVKGLASGNSRGRAQVRHKAGTDAAWAAYALR